MTTLTPTMRKVTVSIPNELVEFADRKAKKQKRSRSELISLLLADLKAKEEAQLAVEGYQFFAQEAIEFAQATSKATAEIMGNGD